MSRVFKVDYIPDPAKGRPLWNAKIFVGVANQDPTIPSNQIQLTGDIGFPVGQSIPVPQPVRTNAGGITVYNNSPLDLNAPGQEYAIQIFDRNDNLIYNFPQVDGSVVMNTTSQEEVTGLTIWPEVGEAVIGQTIPAGTDAIRYPFNGRSTLFTIKPPVAVTGTITNITINSSGIGELDVDNSDVYDLAEFNTFIAANDGDSQLAGGNIWPLSSKDSAQVGDDLTGYEFVRLQGGGVISNTLFRVLGEDGLLDDIGGVITDIDLSSFPYVLQIDGANYSILTKEQSNQYLKSEIDLADWFVEADDSTDNGNVLVWIRSVLQTNQNVTWEITHRDCNFINPSAVISYTINWWLGGIRRFKLYDCRVRCTNNNAFNYLNAPFSSRDCFSSESDFGNVREFGELFQSASRGDQSITLVTAANATKFRPGVKCLITGFNNQTGGWPPNFKYIDFVTIKSSDAATGIIEIEERLDNSYDQNWPDWGPEDVNQSAPRIIAYTKFQSDGWLNDVQGNEYSEFNNVWFEENPNTQVPFNFTSLVRKVIDCKQDIGQVYFCAQNAKLCVTSNLVYNRDPSTRLLYELDKNTKDCHINQPNQASLEAATGVQNVFVNGGSIRTLQIAPRNIQINGSDMSDLEGGILPYSTNHVVSTYQMNNCKVSSDDKTQPLHKMYTDILTINAGQWDNFGSGEVRIIFNQFTLSDFADMTAALDEGSLWYFSANGTQDVGTLKSWRFEGSDIVVSFTGTEQYPNFNTTSNISVRGAFPRFNSCSHFDGAPFSNGRAAQGISSSFSRKEKTTVVYDQNDRLSSSEIVSQIQSIKEIRVRVNRAYTGVDSQNLTFLNAAGGPAGANVTLQIPMGAVGDFVYNRTTDAAWFDRIIQTFRVYASSNPSGDWDDPLLGPRYVMEVDYIPVFK